MSDASTGSKTRLGLSSQAAAASTAAAGGGTPLLTTLSVSRLVATAFRKKGNSVGPKMLGLKPTSLLRASKSLNEVEMGADSTNLNAYLFINPTFSGLLSSPIEV